MNIIKIIKLKHKYYIINMNYKVKASNNKVR